MEKQLTFEEIRALTHGADHMEPAADGIHFHKCTERQENAWKAIDPDFYPRALATTGVRLEFETDAEAFTFEAPSGNRFEVLVNGLFDRQIRMNDLRAAGSEPKAAVPLGPGQKRVLFALPSHSEGVLASFSVENATFLRPVTYENESKILFIGDSITQGWNSQYDTFSFAYRTGLALNADFHICGIGGARYAPQTFEKVNFDPDTVIVAYGTNDFSSKSRSAEENTANANAYLELVRQAYGSCRVVVLTPIWRSDKDEKWLTTARAAIADAARKRGFETVDGDRLFPKNTAFFADNYLHPNDLGFSVYAERLTAYLTGRL